MEKKNVIIEEIEDVPSREEYRLGTRSEARKISTASKKKREVELEEEMVEKKS